MAPKLRVFGAPRGSRRSSIPQAIFLFSTHPSDCRLAFLGERYARTFAIVVFTTISIPHSRRDMVRSLIGTSSFG